MSLRFLPARVFYRLYRLSLPASHPARDSVWFQPGEQDVYLVSYPRSGNTWMRVILAELLYGTSGESIKDLQYYVPDVHIATRTIDVVQGDSHVVKSHLPLHLDTPDASRYRRVIYLVRDPRDVVLSHYRYLTMLGFYRLDFAQFVSDWTGGRIWPCSWHEHVNSWTRDDVEEMGIQIHVLRYEDLLGDTTDQLVQIGTFLGIPWTAATIQRAIAAASVERMKHKENQGMSYEKVANNLPFIGTASARQWEGGLTSEQIREIAASAGVAMERFGYI